MSLYMIILVVWLACAMLVIVAGLSINTRPVSERTLKARSSSTSNRDLRRRKRDLRKA